MFEDFLYVEKYRPKTIKETILPDNLKNTFQQFVDQKQIPNLLLVGPPGCGKTTVARAMLEELNCDYIVINGSLNGNIDTLRNEIMQFASTVSFTGGRKYIILDEADYLQVNSTQPALRNFMEEYSRNCGFILTCNFKNRIIDPLQSRCSVVEFRIPKNEIPVLAAQFLKRTIHILDMEGVKYDKAVISQLIKKHFPDWRRILNEIQRYSANGTIDTGILADLSQLTFKTLFRLLKEKDFTHLRAWVAENNDIESSVLFRSLYDHANEYIHKDSIPQLVLILAKYQYQQSFVADTEINIIACLVEIMVDVKFN